MRLIRPTEESRLMAAKLSVDALALFVVGGIGYLLSEFVLPGIFSSRVNFFLFHAAFGTLLLLTILAWAPSRRTDRDRHETPVSLSQTGIATLTVVATLFLFWGAKKLPVMNIAFGMIATGAVLLVLFSDAFARRRKA